MSTDGKVANGPRDYNAAIAALNTLQTNFAIVDAIRKSGRGMNKNAIPEMQDWSRRVGYEPTEFDRLHVIHVAGTKGKGSTSAFISSILCQCSSIDSSYPQKIGLYTSPHLRSVRERIQINNVPLSEELFARYFFEVWDRLEAAAEKSGPQILPTEDNEPSLSHEPGTGPIKPVYFRYLTLMAFHVYISEGVDTAVIECGIGGEYDSTNIIVSPSVCAVSNLGIDHTAVLGDTIEEIAWHKAGIFKRGSKSRTVYTVSTQQESAINVLQQRASDKGLTLDIVPRHEAIGSPNITLGLAADFQKTNASLAIAAAAAHLRTLNVPDFADTPLPTPTDPKSPLPKAFKQGLEQVQWGGRCETRRQGRVAWHLDGGHTMESIRLSGEWFGGCLRSGAASRSDTAKRPTRVLLFNQQTRDAVGLARALHTSLREILPPTEGDEAPLFDVAIFCTNITFAPTSSQSDGEDAGTGKVKSGKYKPDLVSMNTASGDVEKLTVQLRLAEMWKELDVGATVGVYGTIEEAVTAVRASSAGGEGEVDVEVLVTGSLHLVGGVLEVLDVV